MGKVTERIINNCGEIKIILINIFKNIDVEAPKNIDEIAMYITYDIANEPINGKRVAEGLKTWIESKQKIELTNREKINKAASHYLSDQEEGDLYDAYLKLLEASKTGFDNDLAANYVAVWKSMEHMSVDEMIELIENGIEDNNFDVRNI
jgi:hypothetical protein